MSPLPQAGRHRRALARAAATVTAILAAATLQAVVASPAHAETAIFNTPGQHTFVPREPLADPTAPTRIRVTVLGAGGGGGGGRNFGPGNSGQGGGGGGGAGAAVTCIWHVQAHVAMNVWVGAGGSAGTGQTSTAVAKPGQQGGYSNVSGRYYNGSYSLYAKGPAGMGGGQQEPPPSLHDAFGRGGAGGGWGENTQCTNSTQPMVHGGDGTSGDEWGPGRGGLIGPMAGIQACSAGAGQGGNGGSPVWIDEGNGKPGSSGCVLIDYLN